MYIQDFSCRPFFTILEYLSLEQCLLEALFERSIYPKSTAQWLQHVLRPGPRNPENHLRAYTPE